MTARLLIFVKISIDTLIICKIVKTIQSIGNNFLSMSSPLSLTKKVRIEVTIPYFMNHATLIIYICLCFSIIRLTFFFKWDTIGM